MRTLVLVATLALLPFLSAADHAAAARQAGVNARSLRYSQERLDRIRQTLVAQIAVRDEAEGLMRAPTQQEAAAFALAQDAPPETIALPNGGVALRLDASQISLAVAERSADGNVSVTHAGSRVSGTAVVATGGINDR